MKNICASCRSVDVKNIIKVDNTKKPKWQTKESTENFLKEFLHNLKVYKNIKAQNRYLVKGFMLEKEPSNSVLYS